MTIVKEAMEAKKESSKAGLSQVAKKTTLEVSGINSLDKIFRQYIHQYNLQARKAIKKSFMDYLGDNLLMVEVIRKGIPYSVFAEVEKLYPFTKQDWEEVLDLNMRSILRYKAQNKLFKSIHSEKIIELGEIFVFGIEVFGDEDKFRLWLQTKNFAIGNIKPIELLRDSYGQELVVNELHRMDHGIFA
ncbi:MAG: antitoxin Xre/MbcA/ParS toxin-binding domain-containing protein [Saprospiraceae bacterium]